MKNTVMRILKGQEEPWKVLCCGIMLVFALSLLSLLLHIFGQKLLNGQVNTYEVLFRSLERILLNITKILAFLTPVLTWFNRRNASNVGQKIFIIIGSVIWLMFLLLLWVLTVTLGPLV